MVEWSDKRCMSSCKGVDGRCKNKQLNGYDFCKKHMENGKYSKEFLKEKMKIHKDDIIVDKYLDLVVDSFDSCLKEKCKYLDDNFMHCLFGLNDTWNDVPFIYWYKCDNTWWDIRTFVQTITMQINQSELEKPYPLFPENPFTRQKLEVYELINLRNHIKIIKECDTKFKIHISLQKFLSLTDKCLEGIRKTKTQYNTSVKIIDKLSKTLRYKMINYKDSQGRYCGYWVESSEQLSVFEKCYNDIMPATILTNDMYILLNTPIYRKMLDLMLRLPQEEYNI